MSEYKRAILLISGEVITITEDEEKQVKKMVLDGSEWIEVQNELINARYISKIGSHHATAYLKKVEIYQNETDKKLRDGERPKLDKPDSYLGEPDFYRDPETGEKIYS